MQKSTQNTQPSGSPMGAVSWNDARDAAQQHVDDLTAQFVNAGNATHAERAAVIQNLKSAAATLAHIEARP